MKTIPSPTIIQPFSHLTLDCFRWTVRWKLKLKHVFEYLLFTHFKLKRRRLPLQWLVIGVKPKIARKLFCLSHDIWPITQLLSANKRYNHFTNPSEWYAFYRKVSAGLRKVSNRLKDTFPFLISLKSRMLLGYVRPGSSNCQGLDFLKRFINPFSSSVNGWTITPSDNRT